MPATALVIGAGAAGLATAALLGREGYEVTVLEKNAEIGGRSGEITDSGFRFDTGPSWYLMPDAFEHFYRLLGTSTDEQLDMVRLDPGYRLFPEGEEPLDIPAGKENVIALFEHIEPGAGEALRAYLETARESYDVAVDRFLYTTFSRPGPVLHRDVRERAGLLAGLLARPLDGYVAKRFKDHRLRQILTYPAVFLSSHPARTPAMYHLMSHTDLVQGVRYPQGGFAAVMASLERLARERGARIELGAEVTAITYAGDRASGVRARVAGEERTFGADIVVSAADLHFTETRLLPPEKRTYSRKYFASREPGLGTVLVMLGVRGKLPQLDHHNLLFSRDWEDDFAVVFDGQSEQRPLQASQSIYVSMPSATDPSTAPEGDENLFILVPTPAATDLGRGNAYHPEESEAVRAIADAAIEQVARWCDIPDLADRIVVRQTLGPQDFAERYNAWSGGSIGPAHTLRQSAFLRGRNKSRKLGNLFYAGATTVPGVGVPMCLISAENVVKRLRGDHSGGPLPEEGQ